MFVSSLGGVNIAKREHFSASRSICSSAKSPSLLRLPNRRGSRLVVYDLPLVLQILLDFVSRMYEISCDTKHHVIQNVTHDLLPIHLLFFFCSLLPPQGNIPAGSTINFCSMTVTGPQSKLAGHLFSQVHFTVNQTGIFLPALFRFLSSTSR